MKTIFVDQLSPQENPFTSFFWVKNKEIKHTQDGKLFLNLVLSDRTGDINAVMWKDSGAEEAAKCFKYGEIIKVKGQVGTFKNSLQIKILQIRMAEPDEIDMGDYLPTGTEDPMVLRKEIEGYIQPIENPALHQLLESFFMDDEFFQTFAKAPGAKGMHHVYWGGLLEHTVSVTRLCKTFGEHYKHLRCDLLISGALLHDVGKIRELCWEGGFEVTDEGGLLGHIILGLEMVKEKINAVENFPSELALELEHILISHHGEYDFGSPKRPKTMEALALHYADNLDAKINMYHSHMQQERDKGKGAWTSYHRVMERYLYLGSEEEEEEELI